jgi:hypothetical protein
MDNLVGKKFGTFEVIAEMRPGDWLCRCECGAMKIRSESVLKSNEVLKCKCNEHEDLTGRTFGNLTVEKYSHSVLDYHVWYCKCVCGEVVWRQMNFS